MNGLLAEMRRGMEELQLGLDGALNMSASMEVLLAAIANGRVPPSWMACMSTRIQVGVPTWQQGLAGVAPTRQCCMHLSASMRAAERSIGHSHPPLHRAAGCRLWVCSSRPLL